MEGEGKLPNCFVLTNWWVALQVQKIVRKHYLRDDIAMEPDGGWADSCCVLIDTNVALHQVRAQVSNALWGFMPGDHHVYCLGFACYC